ncbi:ATP phosphoribosyltransferase regulatory subunit [Pseudochrobactrum algeriensis]|uniref:ATP phosphoribosyltransferase regulatory subunit n=1 Tax=Pseudochrobactrum algeriensis TaxID=2834768 RepID=UPI001BCF7496|nr:ATP phosphoribosyltransferase regulatory subunit [Pseudochrobactrum algeriensis]MBX8812019.1 ATP phosphoribosyltransferase regulatory subunit [Ochrobactrum sp. MR34]QVQ37433.1 ATP phosphoribosyltransferase regulatory subunit [Pseudochrobactrum algeriensis]QVQ40652.1 ATP phosphoribosyltransferase regulatory subunit [Pseudochrobactrum algeriensis]QVQ44574.1 ATP phosphoribosyltransferase regulatory subunit [Pseudochrobactrum algeriensis]
MNNRQTADIAADLASYFATTSSEAVDIPILQPADPFLDMAGEDLRSRIFLTENENGDSLCLRPEFTIPVCRNHIALNAATPKRYSYIGEVFRQRREGGTSFHQAGIEDLGGDNEPASDARSLSDALNAVHQAAPNASLQVLLGDQSVFEAVLASLGLPRGWQKKLARAFGSAELLEQALQDLTSPRLGNVIPERLRQIVDEQGEDALVTALAQEMQAAGISPVAGRTPAEIARRLMEKQQLAAVQLADRVLTALKTFLSIRVPLEQATVQLTEFAEQNGLDLGAALQSFAKRVEEMRKAGIDLGIITYDAGFGRPLDYYTGLVYEITSRDADCGVIVGGGRYDRLLTMLGAKERISGVGFSIWLDRLQKCADATRTGVQS